MDGIRTGVDFKSLSTMMSARWRIGLWMALLLGIGVRLFHYVRDPSMWGDEASAVLNVISKNYWELLGPLSHETPSPIVFLWIERMTFDLLGDSTLALRVPSIVASLFTLILAAFMFSRWIHPLGAFAALLLLATSNRLIWHAVEAKPYSIDVLLAILLPSITCWTRHWSGWIQNLLLAAIAPFVITVSYPGVFLMGGVLAARCPLFTRESWHAWMGWMLAALASGGSFLWVLVGPVSQQRSASVDSCWTSYFPHWNEPSTVPFWMLKSWASLPDYAFRPIGMALVPWCFLGAYLLARRGYGRLVWMMVVPILLAFVASLLGKYPFGGARILAFAAPAMSLFVGEVFAWLISRRQVAEGWYRLGLTLVAVPILASITYTAKTAMEPWPSPDSAGAAQWVIDRRLPGDLVLGNHWEHEYYFRDLGPSFGVYGKRDGEEHQRIWLVVADVSPDVRQRLLDVYLQPPSPNEPGWRVFDSCDLKHTRIVGVERTPLAASSTPATR